MFTADAGYCAFGLLEDAQGNVAVLAKRFLFTKTGTSSQAESLYAINSRADWRGAMGAIIVRNRY